MSRYILRIFDAGFRLGSQRETTVIYAGFEFEHVPDAAIEKAGKFIRVDGMTDAEIAARYGVTSWQRLTPFTPGPLRKLGVVL